MTYSLDKIETSDAISYWREKRVAIWCEEKISLVVDGSYKIRKLELTVLECRALQGDLDPPHLESDFHYGDVDGIGGGVSGDSVACRKVRCSRSMRLRLDISKLFFPPKKTEWSVHNGFVPKLT